MGYIRVVALVLASVALFFSMIPGVHAAESKQYKELLQKQNSALIIPFEYKDFNRYVMKNPGDYQVIMFYTLSEKCPHCETTEVELEQVANSYIAAGKHHRNEGENPIFFAKIEYTQTNQDAFKLSGYTSVPVLTVANLELAETYKKTGKLNYGIKYEWKITSMDFTDAGKLIEHVNKVTDSKVDIKFTFSRNLFGASLILAALFFIFFIRKWISDFIRNKVAWNVVSAIVFIQ
jgi:thiol-disulfide isomerase/thioredoxin